MCYSVFKYLLSLNVIFNDANVLISVERAFVIRSYLMPPLDCLKLECMLILAPPSGKLCHNFYQNCVISEFLTGGELANVWLNG